MTGLVIGLIAILQLLHLGPAGPSHWLIEHATPAIIEPVEYKPQATVGGQQPAIELTAAGAIVIDAATGEVLFAKAPTTPRPIASITKVMTALVILRDHKLDETVTVPALPAYTNGAVVLGLVSGQQFKLKELLKAALIPSANDAADSLAINDARSVPKFTAKMNQLAEGWGIHQSHFASATGLDDTDNQASPLALAQAVRLLLANPNARAITATANDTISDLAGHQYTLHSTNELLLEPGFSGIKTGYTPAAGQCLVARATIGGHEVISVVLGSQDRFGETRRLIKSVRENYQWQRPPQ